jgi:hypothetical protein
VSRIDLDKELAALEAMSLGELRVEWVRRTKSNPPKASAGLLRLALAHWLQSRALGGMSKSMDRKFTELAAGTASAKLMPGNRLIRSWNGKVYVVEITDGGLFRWQERNWKSLSEIARTITGTRWSGPAFFGLRGKAA